MKILLDIDGWRKEEKFLGSVLSGRVEVVLYPPMDILAREEGTKPTPENLNAVKVVFEYRGKHKGSQPIFEYVS